MADLEKGIFLPKIDLATVHTKKDLNNPDFTLCLHEPVYLMKYPYNEKVLDPITVILFLCSLKYNDFLYECRYNLSRFIDGILCDCRVIISDKPEGYQIKKKSKVQLDEDDGPEPPRPKKIFKLVFNSLGNVFYIQILGTTDKIKYELSKIQRKSGSKMIYLYNYSFYYDQTLNTPYQIQYPKEIFKKLSILFNNKSSNPERNQFTALLFYRFAPFHQKTISRNKFSLMNPHNDIYDIFNRYSGYLVYIKGESIFKFKGESISAFAWLHPFFFDIVKETACIGLDATFRVLKPFKACIPQCIVQNTGIPLGILAFKSESYKLYDLLFQLIKKIDPSEKLFELFLKLSYITDEHKSFDKLKSVYNLTIYKCFTHLIRTVGSNSALGLLLRDILFSFTEDEFEKNRIKNACILKYLYDNDPKKDEKRYLKIAKVLGIDWKGNNYPTDNSYSPLYIRIEKKVPTTNNYSEAYHAKINEIAGNFKISVHNRLALLANHIMNRIQHVDQSSIANLQSYLRTIKKKAHEKVERSPHLLSHYSKEECNCKRSLYYSILYDIQIPCIHQILNKTWLDTDITAFLKNLSVKDVHINYDNEELLKFFELEESKDDEDDEEEEEPNHPFDEILIQESKFYTDPVEKLIYHIFRHMKRMCQIDKIEVSSTLIKIEQLLLTDEKNRIKLQENYDEYLAILQIKTLEELYKKKGLFDKFY